MSDDWDAVFRQVGYEYCRPCREWHRPPECAIDESGVPDLDQVMEGVWVIEDA